MKAAAETPVYFVQVRVLQPTLVGDQVLGLERRLIHVPKHAAASGLGDLHAGGTGRSEHRAGESF